MPRWRRSFPTSPIEVSRDNESPFLAEIKAAAAKAKPILPVFVNFLTFSPSHFSPLVLAITTIRARANYPICAAILLRLTLTAADR